MSNNYVQLNCSVKTSDYKWLSKELKTAQQQPAVRPFYQCRVVDDNLSPDTLVTTLYPIQGSIATTPDGKIIGAGFGPSNHITFWKGDDMTIFNAAGTSLVTDATAVNAANHIAINVSDYINGTYKIDIYYFNGFDGSLSGGFLGIKHLFSLDGGVTFTTSGTEVPGRTRILFNDFSNVSIAAGKPYLDQTTTSIISTVFYIDYPGASSSEPQVIAYQKINPATGLFGAEIDWTAQNVDTGDWALHSIAVERVKGDWYVSWAGYHQTMEPVNQDTSIINYNIYISKISTFSNTTKNIWTPANPVISALSSSTQNKNSFTLPQMVYQEDLDTLFLVFKGLVVYSVVNQSGAVNVQTKQNFYISEAHDYLNFSYPQPMIFNDGVDDLTDGYSNSIAFRTENGQLFGYLGGDQKASRLIKNNTIADVSSDILNYKLADVSLNPSTINIDIGNQNNDWYAGTPSTNPGNAALAKNNKIALFQGYYNADGVPEVAPKNTYLIDDIQQNVTTNRNDFNLLGRDFYKNLKILQTKFAFNFPGIKKYVDIFDGSTLQNWNVLAGSFVEESSNIFEIFPAAGVTMAIFKNYIQEKTNTTFTVCISLDTAATTGQITYVYLYYVDADTYVRFKIATNGGGINYDWTLEAHTTAGNTIVSFGTIAATAQTFPFTFIRYKSSFFEVLIGDPTDNGLSINQFASPTTLVSTGNLRTLGMGQSPDFLQQPGSVAFGTAGTATLALRNFRYIEFDSSQNLDELTKALATKSSVFDYKMPQDFDDHFFDDTAYSGNYSLVNRTMILPVLYFVSNLILRTGTFDNADVKFKAKITPDPISGKSFFHFLFRYNAGTQNGYAIGFENDVGGTGISIKLYAISSNNLIQLAITDDTIMSVSVDFTVYHDYRVIFFDNYIFVLVDGQIILSWYDNNNFLPFLNIPTGQIGFNSVIGTSASIKEVSTLTLWNQIENYGLNPGDDIENSIETLLKTIRAYFFSDLMGRFKVLKLESTDPSSYTYNEQLTAQVVDNSDKEFVNQITVVGFGNITATVRDNTSIAGDIIRELVINDNKITTYSDALIRANLELIDANKFNNQFNVKQVINVGTEIYDVVRVINTGANTSNIDQVVRNYSQSIQAGGNNQVYIMQLGTGTL